MKKILFIDRDGVLLQEPDDQQIDAFEKIKFPPNMLTSLSKMASLLDYKLVMVTNQDGLGSLSFPEKTFWPVQEFLLETLENVNITFESIHIDRSFPEDYSPYRKPGTAMLSQYLKGEYDLKNSFVIGDRMSDMQLAKNLGCRGIRYNAFEIDESHNLENIALVTNNWTEIESFLFQLDRKSQRIRNTNETKIELAINLDGTGKSKISTGLNFFDHMLDQVAKHSGIDLFIHCKGDLEVDEHHTIEDTAIALGQVINQALSKKVGIQRYGFALPMDDCRTQVLLDFGGRAWLEWDADFFREKIGDCPTEMFLHFFQSLAINAQANINIISYGKNEHHKIESIFKAFARALKMAIKRDETDFNIPTTKGLL